MTDFETELRDRLERSTADVRAGDELYDRAADRYRAHTRRRVATGGAVAVAIVALGAVLGGPLLEQGPESPIVREPEPSPSNFPVPPSGPPPLLLAHENLLDELGLPDDHPVREDGWGLTRAYSLTDGMPTYTEVALEFTDAAGQPRFVTVDEEGQLPWTITGANDVRLEGVFVDNGERQPIVSYVVDGEPAVAVGESEVARGDMAIPGAIERASTVTVRGAGGDDEVVLIAARDSKGLLGYVAYALDGSIVSVVPAGQTLYDFATPCACTTWALTGNGTRVAWVRSHDDGTTDLVVADLEEQRPLAEVALPLGAGTDLGSVRLEVDGDLVLVNLRPDERWLVDARTGEAEPIERVPAGYATFLAPEQPTDDPDPFALPDDLPGWTRLPALPADLGEGWSLGAAEWVGDELVTVWSRHDGTTRVRRTLAYVDADAAWEERAAPTVLLADETYHVVDGDLILLGGPADADGSSDLRPMRGLRYDPASDGWTQLPDAPITERWAHSVTWTGDELIVWGGAEPLRPDAQGTERFHGYTDGAAFDPGSGTWRRIADAPLSPRGDHGAVWNGRELVVFGGGWAESFEGEFAWQTPFDRDDAAVYDPATDTWTEIPSPGAIGPLAAAVWTGERILYWTGHLGTDLPGSWREPGRSWDPVSGGSSPLPAPPFDERRDADISDVSSTWVDELGWIVWGGTCGEGCNRTFAEGAILDVRAGTWSRLQAPAYVGYGARAVWVDGRMFAVGGNDLYAFPDPAAHPGGVWEPR